MHIIKWMYRLIIMSFESVRNVCCFWRGGRSNRSEEQDELLVGSASQDNSSEGSEADRSLTSSYTDYARSNAAMGLFLGHAIAYYCLAVLGYSFLVDKHSIIDSLYLATVTFTTIGYGDVHLSSTAARMYLVFLSTYGIVILGIFLGVLGDIVLETQSSLSSERKRKLQRLVLGSIGGNQGHRGAQLHPPFEPPVSLFRDMATVIGLEAPIVIIVMFFGVLVGGYEGWSVTDSVYWTAVSSFTIGFGDLAPASPAARVFCIFFLPFSVAVIGEVLGRIASVYMDRKRNRAEEAFLRRGLTLRDFHTLDLDSDGQVTKAEFLAYMLVALQKVSKDDIQELCVVFERLDVDRSGTLTLDDLVTTRARS